MRKARYDMKQVVCRNASCIGYSSNIAKPGYWIAYGAAGGGLGRVLGRIAEADYKHDSVSVVGWLAVMVLGMEATHAWVRWVNPADVTACHAKPPAALFAWLAGDEWVKSKADIARLIAMAQHGTTSESFIASRDDADKAYNARPEYVKQFILD
jgi:hypothetical protein